MNRQVAVRLQVAVQLGLVVRLHPQRVVVVAVAVQVEMEIQMLSKLEDSKQWKRAMYS